MNTAILGQQTGLNTMPAESILTWSAKVFIYFEIEFSSLRSPLEKWSVGLLGLADKNEIKYETENTRSNSQCG